MFTYLLVQFGGAPDSIQSVTESTLLQVTVRAPDATIYGKLHE